MRLLERAVSSHLACALVAAMLGVVSAHDYRVRNILGRCLREARKVGLRPSGHGAATRT